MNCRKWRRDPMIPKRKISWMTCAVFLVAGCGSTYVEVDGCYVPKGEAEKRGLILSSEEVNQRREFSVSRMRVSDIVFVYVSVVPSLRHEYTLDTNGVIRLDYAGDIQLLGLTEREAAVAIKRALEKRVFKETQVTVELKRAARDREPRGITSPQAENKSRSFH